MKTSNNGLGDVLLAKFDSLGTWLVRHAKIVMPVVLAACVIITVVISIRANKKEAEQQENIAANSTLEETMEAAEYVVPEVALQQNTIPEAHMAPESGEQPPLKEGVCLFRRWSLSI